MTPIPPNADELVSAYLDGEAAPDEIALVESNDELLARVQELRDLTSPLGAVTQPASDIREAHLAAALGAFDALMAEAGDAPALSVVDDPDVVDEPVGATTPPPADPVVRSLDAAREKRRGSFSRNGLIAAAAAVVLLFVGITALSVRSGGDSLDVAGDATSASDAADTAEAAEILGNTDLDAASRAQAPAAPAPAQAESADSAAEPESAADAGSDDAAEEEAMEAEEEADDAMADDEAMEDAADDDGEEGSDNAGAAVEAPDDDGYFVGEFATLDDLEDQIRSDYDAADLAVKALLLPQGLFSNCQVEIPALASTDPPTLTGAATVANDSVEIHLLNGDQVMVVDSTGCEILRQFSLTEP